MSSLDGPHCLPRTRPTLAAAAALLLAFGAGAASSPRLDPLRNRARGAFALAEFPPASPLDAAAAAEEADVADTRRVALVRAGYVVVRVLLVAAGRAGVVTIRPA